MIQLGRASSFNPGADLWILPPPEFCKWHSRIDWYLNFQLARSRSHQRKQPSERLQKLIEECEIPFSPPELPKSSPILIASAPYLPNQWVAEIPLDPSHLEPWIEQVMKVWKNLNYPSLRIFSPAGSSARSIDSIMQTQKAPPEWSLVTDI